MYEDGNAVMAEEEDLDVMQLYLNEIGQFKLLAPDEEKDLAARAKTDPDAREAMINANLRLPASIAKHYAGCGMPYLDLVQEGNIGLMRAVDEYDPDKGVKFGTYATWWIRQAMLRAASEQGRVVRIPSYMNDNIRKMNRATQELAQELFRDPTPEEVAERMGIKVEALFKIYDASMEPASLDVPAGDEETEGTVGDMIEDETMVDPAEIAEEGLRNSLIAEALDELDERERKVLNLRFGLTGEAPMTLEAVGKALEISRERARQIEVKALRRLSMAG